MSLRLIHHVKNVNRTCKVYRDSEWNEYRVRLSIDGKLYEPADYHCTDKDEALDMAAYMVLTDDERISNHQPRTF